MTPQFNRLVRRQAGCFTRRQIRQQGTSASEAERHIFDGVWLPVMGDVLIVAGAPVTERMKSWTAVLAAGGFRGSTSIAWSRNAGTLCGVTACR